MPSLAQRLSGIRTAMRSVEYTYRCSVLRIKEKIILAPLIGNDVLYSEGKWIFGIVRNSLEERYWWDKIGYASEHRAFAEL